MSPVLFAGKLSLEGFGDGDLGVVGAGVFAPAEVLEGVGAAGEDVVSMKSEVIPSAFVEVFIPAFDKNFAVFVILERAEGEVEEVAVEFEVSRVGFEKFFEGEGGFVEAALHAE